MPIFEVALESFIDMNHELVVLSNQIDWSEVESDFSEYYCADNGRPSVPIRTMVGMMLLKSIYNLSDEGVVARWSFPPGWKSRTARMHPDTGYWQRSSSQPLAAAGTLGI